MPFQITVHACAKVVPGTVLDEGASISLIPSTTWQDLGSPPLGPVTQNLLPFDRGAYPSLGVLPRFPITLGSKTICIDVLVTQGALYFNLLLGRDYVYAMGALVSSLFRVVCFPRDGRIVTIDQLSFFSPPVPPMQLSSPPGFYPPVVSAPPQINYVATYLVPVSSDAAIIHSVLGALVSDFRDVVLPLGVALLEAPTSCSL